MPEGPNLLKQEELYIPKPREHLEKGVKHIVACVGTPEDFGKEWKAIRGRFKKNSDKVHNVDFHAEPSDFEGRHFLSGEQKKTYVISPLDNLDKFSEGLYDCTGVIVVGIDEETGKNISFITHQDPGVIFSKDKSKFVEDLAQRLAEVKKRCRPRTIDAIIVGGNASPRRHSRGLSFTEVYLASIKFLSLEVETVLGFEPMVLNGAKEESTTVSDDIYYDNENRILYFVRSKVDHGISDFLASDIDKEIQKGK